MDVICNLCYGVSFGITIGFLAGVFKIIKRPSYSEEQVQKTQKLLKKIANVLKYLTMLSLALGLIWCIYFLILGVYDAGQAEYATNMAQLIVSFLTVISIIFAFFEFLQHKGTR